MTPVLTVFPTNQKSVEFQMALDEAVFQSVTHSPFKAPILRFYEFHEPSVTIGFGQRNLDALPMTHLPWTRRLTGGGFVRHDNDLVLSFVCPIDLHSDFKTPKSAYLSIHQVLWNAFQDFGVETMLYGGCKEADYSPEHMLCFERPICDDIILNHRKIAGGAQRRSGDYFLHQESIDFSVLKDKGVLRADFEKEVILQFEKAFHLQSVSLPFEESLIQLAGKLTDNKYRSESWKLKGHQPHSKKEVILHG